MEYILMSYTAYATVLDDNAIVSDMQRKPLQTLLSTMDEGWKIIDRMTFGLLAGSLACSTDKKDVWVGMDTMRRIFLKVNVELAEAMHGNIDRVDLLSLEAESEKFAKIMRSVEGSLTSLGLGLVTQFISRLPELWVQQLDMVAMARNALLDISEETSHSLVDIHLRNVKLLNAKLVSAALSMNSEPFKKIEQWAKVASVGFDHLILQGYLPQTAYMAVVEKYGSPWA